MPFAKGGVRFHAFNCLAVWSGYGVDKPVQNHGANQMSGGRWHWRRVTGLAAHQSNLERFGRLLGVWKPCVPRQAVNPKSAKHGFVRIG